MPRVQDVIIADKETLDNIKGNIIANLVNYELIHKKDVSMVDGIIFEALRDKVEKGVIS